MSRKLRAVNLVIGLLLIGTLIAPLEGASPRVASADRQETRFDEPLADPPTTLRQTALVLVNSQSAGYLDFQHFIQPYLDHFGIPYTTLDISTTAVTANVNEYALLIIGHRNIDSGTTPYLTAEEDGFISGAVNSGSGLVNFDNALSADGSNGRYQFIADVFTFGYNTAISGANVTFADPTTNYIIARHTTGQTITTNTMTLAGITLPTNVTALASSGAQPLVAVTTHGSGRAVQFGSYDWISHSVKGPLFGLDDLFWRSIVWAARKPFVMQGLPPFVTMRMDDTSGPLWWIHAANDYGFIPWAGVFTADIDNAEAADLSALVNSGKATSTIHAFESGTSRFFYYDHNNSQNYSDSVVAANFDEATKWFADRNIPIGKYATPHYYEIGSNVFGELETWGVKYISTVMDPGQSESSAPWMMAGPFRLYETGAASDSSQNIYYADYLPTNPGFFNCITEIRDVTGYEWLGNGRNSVPDATADGIEWLKRPLDSMAIADLFSHEYTFINSMSEADWRTTLQGITTGIADYSPMYVSRDYACAYARAVHDSNISGGTYDPALKQITVDLDGTTEMETKFYVFTEGSGQIVQQLVDVPTFSGTTQISYTIPDPPPPPHDDGPGGPILIISSAANPFTRYYTEILRTEGLNEFLAVDVSSVNAAVLSGYQVAILGEMTLTPAQVTMLTDWVNAGGNLIAVRPDPQLAGLLGLTATGATFSNGYLLVNTSTAPGAGIVDQTIQYHDAADLYALNGATVIATLYSDSTTATSSPAVSLVDVGTNGGQAAAFTFDLAKSIVYTRQGNPAWKDINGDGNDGPVRADDMFHNGTDPDWVNLDKIAIPQADEQQRLLANLILTMNQDNNPLPRFWYFPHGEKAVVLFTSDDHGSSNLPGMLDLEKALSPTNCSVNDWECVRSSAYTYSGTLLTQEQANAYAAEGFEIGVHVDTGCANYSMAELESFYTTQLTGFAERFPALPIPASERTHCVAWSGWASQADVKAQKGIRLDTNYYFWPPAWVNNQPGLFTGSGMPMRFADLDGTLFNVYQATTQMTDESGQTYPYTTNTLLSRALAAEGYYGVFTANIHSDLPDPASAYAIIAAAQENGVPVVSGRQLLNWLDGRNSSAFTNIAWSSNMLTFDITSPFGTRPGWLQAMVPAHTAGGALSRITIGGSLVAHTLQSIKGIQYAVFDARAGTVVASYVEDTTPPAVVSFSPANGATNVATSSPVTATFSEPVDVTTINSNTFELRGPGDNVVPATVTYNFDTNTTALTPGAALNPNSSYLATLKGGVSGVTDMAGNPLAADATWSFATAADTSVADFGASTANSCYIADTDDGEVILTPIEGTEFDGAALPAGWEGSEWSPGGSVSVGGGHLTLSNGYARTTSLYGAGRVLEFVATFSKRTTSQNQHAGFGDDLTADPWALFSTGSSGSVLKARSTGAADTDLGASYLGSSHLYRIEWYADHIVYYIDGVQVADHVVTIDAAMRPIASDGTPPATLSIDWMRMSPFVSQCSLTSRVFDAGETVIWDAMDWNGAVPTGASLVLSFRIGNSPTPDGYWTAFVPVASSPAALGANSRYIQYRADLASTDAGRTPGLHDVSFANHTAPLQPPVLTAARSGADVILRWPHPGFGFDHYEVHRALAPYFGPDGSSFVDNVGRASAGTLEYPDIGRVGAGAAFFYVVVPVESNGWRHPASNRVGIFSFDLVSPPSMP